MHKLCSVAIWVTRQSGGNMSLLGMYYIAGYAEQHEVYSLIRLAV